MSVVEEWVCIDDEVCFQMDSPPSAHAEPEANDTDASEFPEDSADPKVLDYRVDEWPDLGEAIDYRVDEWPETTIGSEDNIQNPYENDSEAPDLLSWVLRSKSMLYGWDLPREPPKARLDRESDRKAHQFDYNYFYGPRN